MSTETEIIAEQVAERMDEFRRERHYKQIMADKRQILAEAFSILKELGEIEISTAMRKRAKAIGDKLKAYD